MKTHRFLLTALLAIAPAVAARAAEQPARNPRLQVAFYQPEKFTDVRETYSGGEREREDYFSQVRDYLSRQIKYYVPEGERLEITFTDIDMAGDFEPWHGPDWQDVRIVKDIYPPRMDLTFRLVDANGNVLKQGARKLNDLAFMLRVSPIDRNDPLRYEKALLDDWLRQEFPPVKRS